MSSTHTSHLVDMVVDETIRLLGVKSHPNTHKQTHTLQITPLSPLETSHTVQSGPNEPMQREKWQKRELGVWRTERQDRGLTDLCSFEVMPAISNITLSGLMGVYFVEVKGDEWRAEIRGENVFTFRFNFHLSLGHVPLFVLRYSLHSTDT